MKSLAEACEHTEYLLDLARQNPSQLASPSGQQQWKSLHQKLFDLYIKESGKEAKHKLLHTSNLLDKLVASEKLTCLIVNLYPGNEGYTLMLKNRNGVETETIRLPYEESEMLRYIDNEELPPILVDLLERSQTNVFYNGCIIVEVRDYRRNATGSEYDTHYTLLKPTTQSLICDVNAMTSDSNRWTAEDRVALEAQLVLATNEPLCLEPDITVAVLANKLQHQKYKMNTVLLKRSVRRFSQVAINRQRKFASLPAPPSLKLHDFIIKRRDKIKNSPAVNLKIGKQVVDSWRQKPVDMAPPESVDVEKYTSVLEKPKSTPENTQMVIAEHILETEKSPGRLQCAQITIQQRLSDEVYTGELHMDPEIPGDFNRAQGCSFTLGTKADAERYAAQFQQLFTDEGRKPVKIRTLVPGQEPHLSISHGGVTISSPSSHTPDPKVSSTLAKLMKSQMKLPLTQTTTSPSPLTSPIAAQQSPLGSQSLLQGTLSGPSNYDPGLTSPLRKQMSRQLFQQPSSAPHSSNISPVLSVANVLSPPHSSAYLQSTSCVKQTAASSTPPPLARTPTPKSRTDVNAVAGATAVVGFTGAPQLDQQLHHYQQQQNVQHAYKQQQQQHQQQHQQQQPPQPSQQQTTINLANLNLSSNVNLIPALQAAGLQNVQVSLTSVPMPGSIAVPVSLAMVSGQQGILMPNVITSSAPSSTLSQGEMHSQLITMLTNMPSSGSSGLSNLLSLPLGSTAGQVPRFVTTTKTTVESHVVGPSSSQMSLPVPMQRQNMPALSAQLSSPATSTKPPPPHVPPGQQILYNAMQKDLTTTPSVTLSGPVGSSQLSVTQQQLQLAYQKHLQQQVVASKAKPKVTKKRTTPTPPKL